MTDTPTPDMTTLVVESINHDVLHDAVSATFRRPDGNAYIQINTIGGKVDARMAIRDLLKEAAAAI